MNSAVSFRQSDGFQMRQLLLGMSIQTEQHQLAAPYMVFAPLRFCRNFRLR
jgi:hypothetical protein